MSLYAIGDLHFSTLVEKPMNIFGDKWEKHEEKIISSWKDNVKDEDVVLVLGDTSWGINLTEAKPDLDIISNLCGNKIFIKGNHDYWWSSISKLNAMYENMKFIQNNFYTYNDYAICGTRGWIDPSSDKFNSKDAKIYAREQIRIRLSLDAAKKSGFNKFIVMIHYPPFGEENKESELMKIFQEYNVEKVIYGHLHGPSNVKAIEGLINGVEYIMTSCDFINFDPIKILED